MPQHLCTNTDPDSCTWIPTQKALVAPSMGFLMEWEPAPHEWTHSLITSLDVSQTASDFLAHARNEIAACLMSPRELLRCHTWQPTQQRQELVPLLIATTEWNKNWLRLQGQAQAVGLCAPLHFSPLTVVKGSFQFIITIFVVLAIIFISYWKSTLPNNPSKTAQKGK